SGTPRKGEGGSVLGTLHPAIREAWFRWRDPDHLRHWPRHQRSDPIESLNPTCAAPGHQAILELSRRDNATQPLTEKLYVHRLGRIWMSVDQDEYMLLIEI